MTPQERRNQAEPNVVNTSPNLLSYGGLVSLARLKCDSDCERSRPASIR